MTAPRCPVGVIEHQGRTLTYEPHMHTYRIVVFGTGEVLGCSDELRAAIEADIEHIKAKEDGR